MCHSREIDRKINQLHGRYLRTIYNGKESSCNKLLEKDGSVSIYEQNLRAFATEMYKISNGLSTPLMKDIFSTNINAYNLRQNSQFSRSRINTVYHLTRSICNLVIKIWDLVPSNLKEISDLKETSDLDKFKKAIKQWKHEDCLCRMCKFFVQNVGFLQNIT